VTALALGGFIVGQCRTEVVMGRIRIINRIEGFMGHFHAFLSGCCYGGMWHVACSVVRKSPSREEDFRSVLRSRTASAIVG
jgi:hypothetical protein